MVGLAIGWFFVTGMAILGWVLVAPDLGASPRQSSSGLLGSVVSLLVMGIGLMVIRPWIPRHASELPTAWLATSVVRLLVVPVQPRFCYISPFCRRHSHSLIGVVSAYVVLLAVEVLLIVLAMQRQFEKMRSLIIRVPSITETD